MVRFVFRSALKPGAWTSTVKVPGCTSGKMKVSVAQDLGGDHDSGLFVDQLYLGVGDDALGLIDDMSADGGAGGLRDAPRTAEAKGNCDCDERSRKVFHGFHPVVIQCCGYDPKYCRPALALSMKNRPDFTG